MKIVINIDFIEKQCIPGYVFDFPKSLDLFSGIYINPSTGPFTCRCDKLKQALVACKNA